MKYRVKSKEQIVKWLEENGYKKYDGHWEHDYFISFGTSMFDYCGSEPDMDLVWLPDWLEEVKTPDELLEYDETEIEKGIAENKDYGYTEDVKRAFDDPNFSKILKETSEMDLFPESKEPKLTHEQVFDLWFEMSFMRGFCRTWCKVSDFSGSTYYFMAITDGVIEQKGFHLEELQKLPHAKIPPRV